MRARLLLLVTLAVASCDPSYPTPTTDCKTDDDCAVDDVSRDCCGHPCGLEPPWIPINRTSREALVEVRKARCEGKKLDCPYYTCVAPDPCESKPKPVCNAGTCAVVDIFPEGCPGPGSK